MFSFVYPSHNQILSDAVIKKSELVFDLFFPPGGKYDYALEATFLLIGCAGLFEPLRSYQGRVASRSYLLSLWSARDIFEFWFSAPLYQNLRQKVLKWKHFALKLF